MRGVTGAMYNLQSVIIYRERLCNCALNRHRADCVLEIQFHCTSATNLAGDSLQVCCHLSSF